MTDGRETTDAPSVVSVELPFHGHRPVRRFRRSTRHGAARAVPAFTKPPVAVAMRNPSGLSVAGAAPKVDDRVPIAYGGDASRAVLIPRLWFRTRQWDDAHWHTDGDHGDDWDEIASQESFLASDVGAFPCWDDPEDDMDEPWPSESVTALH